MNRVYLGETEVANTGSGGAGGGISYDELNASLNAYTYDKAHIDASFAAIPSGGGGGSFDPTDINSSISDISTRVQTLEFNSLVSDDISTFIEMGDVQKYTYNKAHIDASFAAIPDSGDPFDPTDINASIGDISTRVDNISIRVQSLEFNSLDSDDISTFIEIGDVQNYTYNKAHINSSISDISTRVDNINSRVQTLEFNSLDSDDISTFIEICDVQNYTYNKAHIDASFAAIPSGGGSFDPTDINSSINDISTRVNNVSTYVVDVSSRMPIFEYNSATQTLNIIA